MKTLNLKDNTPNPTINKIPQNNSLCKYLSGRTIAELNESENILVWPTSFKDGEDDIKDQVLFDCKFSFDGKNIEEIQTHNLIGFIGGDKTQIEIRTRFSEDGKQDYFLYYMLSIVLSCNIVDMQVGKGIESALDMMTLFFSGLLTKAVNQGVYKKYVSREYNDSNVRGTIDVSRHIRYNYPSNGRVAYNTREYSYDNDVTQLIRHTIEYIKSKNEFQQIKEIAETYGICIKLSHHVYDFRDNDVEYENIDIEEPTPLNYINIGKFIASVSTFDFIF
jgi:5-methylcytosine-specific restriction endonuclease McrBC regulatory subunit McrC